MKALRWSALAGAVAVYVMIVFGALVRSTNSGLSCPDWPTCYGYWLLTPETFAALGETGYSYTQVMLEWGHRAFAAFIIGPIILAVVVFAFRARQDNARLPRFAILLAVLLLIQAKLGGVTVLDQNSPWSVALHLSTALLILSVLLLIAERARAQAPSLVSPAGGGLRRLAGAVWLGALVTMASAAMTAKSGASLACYTWPDCNGAWLPPLDDWLTTIHVAHRTLAGLTALGVLILMTLVLRAAALPPDTRPLAIAAAILIIGQVLLGGLVIVLHVPIWAGVAHQALGVATFIVLTTLMWRLCAARPLRPGQHDNRENEAVGNPRLQSA
ncbi:MAG: heme A synthase [Geminicoccaceae bacterium]